MTERHCECFGDSGLHASTHGDSRGRTCCDLCGWPIKPGAIDVLTAVNSMPADVGADGESKRSEGGND
jgi:hypothetical protein